MGFKFIRNWIASEEFDNDFKIIITPVQIALRLD